MKNTRNRARHDNIVIAPQAQGVQIGDLEIVPLICVPTCLSNKLSVIGMGK